MAHQPSYPAQRATTGLRAGGAVRWLPVLSALLLGVTLLFGVGFAQPHLLHNAAHDVRHAAGLPCH